MTTLPLRTREPRAGMQWTVVDADGKLVCECDGEEEGRAEAEAIVACVNAAPRMLWLEHYIP